MRRWARSVDSSWARSGATNRRVAPPPARNSPRRWHRSAGPRLAEALAQVRVPVRVTEAVLGFRWPQRSAPASTTCLTTAVMIAAARARLIVGFTAPPRCQSCWRATGASGRSPGRGSLSSTVGFCSVSPIPWYRGAGSPRPRHGVGGEALATRPRRRHRVPAAAHRTDRRRARRPGPCRRSCSTTSGARSRIDRQAGGRPVPVDVAGDGPNLPLRWPAVRNLR